MPPEQTQYLVQPPEGHFLQACGHMTQYQQTQYTKAYGVDALQAAGACRFAAYTKDQKALLLAMKALSRAIPATCWEQYRPTGKGKGK